MIDRDLILIICVIILVAALVWDNRHYLGTLDDDD